MEQNVIMESAAVASINAALPSRPGHDMPAPRVVDDERVRSAFQRLVQLAARLVNAPFAIVCLEHAERWEVLAASGVLQALAGPACELMRALCRPEHGLAERSPAFKISSPAAV